MGYDTTNRKQMAARLTRAPVGTFCTDIRRTLKTSLSSWLKSGLLYSLSFLKSVSYQRLHGLQQVLPKDCGFAMRFV